MRCVIYARVSSKEQEKEGYSIPAQLKVLKAYAIEKGLEIVQEYVDVETAKRAGRTDFTKMLTYLKNNKECDILLVEKTDRLYRNIRDWVTLDDLDVEVHFVKENFVLSKDSKSSEKFLHGIKVLMAKNYIDNLSEEVKKGLLEKADQGQWPHRAPVGYRNNKESHRIEIDPQKGPLIKRIFELYAAEKYSLKALSRFAKDSGLFSRNSITINKGGIHRILNNPIYYGEFIWKGKRYIGDHEPLISKVLFDQVQEVFHKANHPIETKRKLAFAGLLKCEKCGCSLTPDIKKGKYIYYHCTQYRGQCDNVYVREEKLADLLKEVVKQIQIDDSMVEDIKAALLSSQKDKIQYHENALKSLNQRHSRIRNYLDKAYEDKLNGEISDDLWQRKSQEWNDELVDIGIQIRSHQNANANYFQTGVKILELANRAYNMYLKQGRHEQRKLLDTILSNCTFYRGTLYPTYRKPFDLLAKCPENITKRG